MKREDLRTKLKENGVTDENLGAVVDYIMAQNGTDIQSLKDELETTRKSHNEQLATLQEENKTLKTQVGNYKDYDELKKFKADTLEKVELNKKTDFLKSHGCKHPDLVIGKLDFTKAEYDEQAKTYKGLDEQLKNLKTSYGDLFEQGTARIDPNIAPKGVESDFMKRYKEEHPDQKL